MNLKVKLLLFQLTISCFSLFGQAAPDDALVRAQQVKIRKQIVGDQLDTQVREIRFAAVRVFVRYRIAYWLWKDGDDNTERAEHFCVKAIEDLYENKVEIPELYFSSLRTDLFALLETHNKAISRKLARKYELSFEDDLQNANALLNKKDGEKIAAQKILKSLDNSSQLSSMTTWLMEELRNRRSPELLKVLAKILVLEESGRSDFSAETLFYSADFFRDANVPNEFRLRFYRIILGKVKNTTQFQNDEVLGAFDLLNATIPDIAQNAPDLSPEASAMLSLLSTKIPRSASMMREIYQRIEDSSDRLSALISEADKVDDPSIKESLLVDAAKLALKNGKFILAVDLAVRTVAVRKEKSAFLRWGDQFLGDVAKSSLKKDDINSAKYAQKQIHDKFNLVESLRHTAIYYLEKTDFGSAGETVDDALKILSREPNDSKKVGSLVRLIPAGQRVDISRVSEITGFTSKAINAMPTLNVEDKPETANYKKYVSSIMAVNYNLLPVLSDLVNKNRNEAIDFSSRIDRKEVKIIAELALLTCSLDAEKINK